MEQKQVISADEMVQKIRAAVAARSDPKFVLIARTDSLAVEGVTKAIDRAKRYTDADVLFVEAPTTEKEIETVAEELRGHKLLLNWLEHGKTPPVPLSRIRSYRDGPVATGHAHRSSNSAGSSDPQAVPSYSTECAS